jgi:hypothetical protein
MFFITEIDVETPEEAVAEVLAMGYCLPRDAFELSAKRVPVLPEREPNANANPNEPARNEKQTPGAGVRATATRK